MKLGNGLFQHAGNIFQKQVDILISKNQVLQILYLKHIKLHKLSWIETHKNLIPTKLNNDIVQFYCYIAILNKNIPYNWPSRFSAVSYVVPYALFN